MRMRADACNRRKMFDRIVRQAAVEINIGDHRLRGAEQQGVAIGGRLRREFGSDDAARAAAIIDDELLAEYGRDTRAEFACRMVGVCAWSIRDDEPDGPFGIGGRKGRRAGSSAYGEKQYKHFIY